MLPVRKPQSPLVQFGDLVLVELTNWRWTWKRMLLLGIIAPTANMLALKALLATSDPSNLVFAYAGNLVLALMFENQNRVAGHLVFMRFHGTLEYLSSLPIGKYVIVLAVAFAFFILSLPAIFVVGIAGSWLLALNLVWSPAVLIVIPLCAISMAGLGALVGVLARTSAEANSLSFVITIVLAGAGPVIIPPGRLPPWLIQLSALNPATYAASALRQSVIGPVTPRLGLDLTVLAAFSVLTLWVVNRKLDWRQ